MARALGQGQLEHQHFPRTIDVIQEARSQGRTVHFGQCIPLRYIKPSQLFESPRTYKGSVVLRELALIMTHVMLPYYLNKALPRHIRQLPTCRQL